MTVTLERDWLTTQEVAAILRCAPKTVADEIRRNNLRASKAAGRWLVSPGDLQRYISSGFNIRAG